MTIKHLFRYQIGACYNALFVSLCFGIFKALMKFTLTVTQRLLNRGAEYSFLHIKNVRVLS